MLREISPLDLRTLIDEHRNHLVLLDVREPEEHDLVRLPNSRLIPMMEIEARLEEIRELSRSAQCGSELPLLVLYCRSGKRSEMAGEWLSAQGIEPIAHLRGGINAYAKEADTSYQPY